MGTLIGKSEKRLDAYDKVTGKGLYASDYHNQFPNLAHVKAFRSPYAHAKIDNLDVGKATALKGVIRIITGYEGGVNWDEFPKTSILAKGEAVWAGQIIALVVAETLDIAGEAIELIEVDIEKLPAVLDYYAAIDPDPVSVVDPDYETRDQGFSDRPMDRITDRVSPNIVGGYKMDNGNVDEALKEADIIVEGEYWTGKKTANPMECANAICRYDTDGGITMWSNGCGVHGVIKQGICRILGMQQSKVRIQQPYLGGSFGSRLNPFIEILIAMVCQITKRTVSFQYTREELFIGAPSNWPCITKIKLGAKKDGTIIVNDYYLAEEIGACVNNSFFSGRLSSSGAASVYRFPNMRMDTCAVATNTVPAGEYRGLGCPESEFGIECLINELAEKLDMSPVDIRLRNILDSGDRNAYGECITSIGLKKCLQSVTDEIRVEEKPEQDGSVWKKGRGCGVGGKQNTPLGRSEARVLYHCDGSIELLISCDENGMGATTAMAQIVANEFQVSITEIKVTKGDTAITPYDNYSASSRTTYNTGNAVLLACEDAISKLKTEIAREYGLHPSKVEIKGKTAILAGSHLQEIDISSVFKPTSMFTQGNWGLFIGSPVVGHGLFCPAPARQWDEKGVSDRVWNWFQYSAAAVEVAVNEETGQVKILRVACSADTGNPINPKMIESQIEGGIHMSIGFYLNEEHLYDDNGKIWNANFSDYRLPTILDMPKNADMISLINPDALPDGPYGAKGMAESIMIPAGPAIAEAIYQAVGVRVTGYPMTAERILGLIREKKEAEGSE